jgi:hypothetical protein
MNIEGDQQAFEERRALRSHWSVRKGRLGDPELEADISPLTPEERLAMVWPLTVQAWAFKGVDVATSRLPRHVIRVARRER